MQMHMCVDACVRACVLRSGEHVPPCVCSHLLPAASVAAPPALVLDALLAAECDAELAELAAEFTLSVAELAAAFTFSVTDEKSAETSESKARNKGGGVADEAPLASAPPSADLSLALLVSACCCSSLGVAPRNAEAASCARCAASAPLLAMLSLALLACSAALLACSAALPACSLATSAALLTFACTVSAASRAAWLAFASVSSSRSSLSVFLSSGFLSISFWMLQYAEGTHARRVQQRCRVCSFQPRVVCRQHGKAHGLGSRWSWFVRTCL